DSDHPRVAGDVGMAGVAIDSVEDMKVERNKDDDLDVFFFFVCVCVCACVDFFLSHRYAGMG
ncbi:methylmalonyl-CoA mutase family protein, partial [Acinetobacter baumannii]